MAVMLSPNFSLAEMTKSNHGSPNQPDAEELECLKALCVNMLEHIRTKFGPVIINMNGGFRDAITNPASGGVPTSQHRFGQASDIHIIGVANADIWRWIVSSGIGFDKVIAEKLSRTDGQAGWVHVSYRVDRARRDAISFLGKQGGYVKGLRFVD